VSRPFPLPDPEALERIRAESERRLSREEFDAWIAAPWSAEEEAAARELIRWFVRRYPTAGARLRAAREATLHGWRGPR
jgi:hypothetical protein